MMLKRRNFLKNTGLSLMAMGLSPVLLAKTDTETRLVVVLLRGAMARFRLVRYHPQTACWAT